MSKVVDVLTKCCKEHSNLLRYSVSELNAKTSIYKSNGKSQSVPKCYPV